MEYKNIKYLIVGSGLFGSTIAERIASKLNEKVIIVEKRSHIGGNCYSEINPETGIEIHTYGSHIFHTSNSKTWNYINKFSSFNTYQHKVLTHYNGKVYSMPFNLNTINQFYNRNFKPFEAEIFIKKERTNFDNPKNLEEKAISLIGKKLYKAFIKGYTLKQWNTDPKKLPSSIIKRIPVRYSYNDCYFNDTWQGLPKDGYTNMFTNILNHKNIDIMLKTDYFDIKSKIPSTTRIIYTGPLDRYFKYKHGMLGWRTLSFEHELHSVKDYQGTPVMNYADVTVPYTRVHEYKHYHPERTKISNLDKTIITKEFSITSHTNSDPYYPINTEKDSQIADLYKQEILKIENVIFGGRLGEYKYFDMDKTIESALHKFETKIMF